MTMAEDVVVCLHGDLDLKIIRARKLPNMDIVSERFRRCFSALDVCKVPFSKKHKSHHLTRKIITSDPYVSVGLAGATVARTRVVSNSQDPFFDEHFKIPLAHPVYCVDFTVKDHDMFGAELIGVARVPASRLKSGEEIEEWFPIIAPYGRPPKTDCAILLRMKFTSCEENEVYKSGLGLQNSYFPVRHGGNVTLYQDAHVPDGMLPRIKLDDDKVFKNDKCWEDICHAILEAHHLIYIAGWSIYHKVRLVREPSRPLPSGGNLTLGELLKYKSQEGVRVLLLVWDDKTSHSSKFFFNTAGVMQTHDEETRKFFKHSSVHCVLAPRYASNKLSFIKQQVVGTLYTHHQKCVIVDTQASGNNRKITSFLGGLDLCDGRYDTPEHRLFKDLNTVFQDDVHNPSLTIGSKGPREPWHDLHCKIEGPAAYDVLTNFEQRWRKATKWSKIGRRLNRMSHWNDDALLKVERISFIMSPSSSVPNDDTSLWVSKEEDPENWHVQVFRSIDSGSVNGFPKDVHLVEEQNLAGAKHNVIDRSIQTAYIKAIRSAKNFIYIENQYFIGSSYAWSTYRNAGAHNLIPMEIALKVASKIRAKERFSVYIVIPMWPEGNPNSAAMQEILYWQRQTMQMMYRIIAKELKSMKLDNMHPTDYLNFYCLGNREEVLDDDSGLSPPPGCHGGATVSNSLRRGRFMIYVHAKGMIVDDEYVILGSANINQRSMAGSRDTEIAMGAYQPHYTWTQKGKHPRGQVYGYRMSLWAEHMEKVENCFNEPQSLECVTHVNQLSEDNWKKYAGIEFTPLQGHLLKYPVRIDGDGRVRPMPGYEWFPDVGGKVLGSHNSLPDALTT